MQTIGVTIEKAKGLTLESLDDEVAVEEPLELRVNGQSVAVLMRTPKNDEDLAFGFLFCEGVIKNADDVKMVQISNNRADLLIAHSDALTFNSSHNRIISSSCGICSKSSIEALALQDCALLPSKTPLISTEFISALPKRLLSNQSAFHTTGGLHACALFSCNGELLCSREDIGRHNALDKLIGARIRQGELCGNDSILMLSGRVSYELMQKALLAGIPIVAAVGAPTSLAISVAQRFNMTLIGFLRHDTMNVYCGAHRIVGARKGER